MKEMYSAGQCRGILTPLLFELLTEIKMQLMALSTFFFNIQNYFELVMPSKWPTRLTKELGT